MAVVGLFVLLALLVVVVVAANRQFATLADRIAVLEAKGRYSVLADPHFADAVVIAAASP